MEQLKDCPGPSPLDALVFSENSEEDIDILSIPDFYMCPVCWSKIKFSLITDLFSHLREKHKLLVADQHLICDFRRYLNYWQERFQEKSLAAFNLPTTVEDNETYHVLCDKFAEDCELRQRLQMERLKVVLKAQQKERQEDSFSARCLFCQDLYSGNRSDLFNHMAQDHNFNVGLPDNLVFTSEFLRILRERMESLHCLFCEKLFRDKIALREHMRKKQHRKLNPQNKSYDKYYIINYLELGKGWQAVQAEHDGTSLESENENWDDWREMAGANAVCLFCDHTAVENYSLLEHMKQEHGFDLDHIKKTLKLNFYEQLKIVNFIRRRIHQKMCFSCHEVFTAQSSLIDHMINSGHIQDLPDNSEWNQPQYYIPTYENDTLLFGLKDDDDELVTSQTPVVAEETNVDIENSVLRDIHFRSSLAAT